MTDSLSRAAAEMDETEDGVQWPLSFRLQKPLQSSTQYWSYNLYRGPGNEKVQVQYSKDRAQSEKLAREFLGEPVVGFDMEWPCFSSKNDRLQEKIGLIQVASEDLIGLFHIGVHPGKTTDEIIAPSLRKLIESPTIAKTGVGILGADFSRLKRFFGLNPQGAFELSHFDRLVKFAYKPELLTTKLVKLAYQVQDHLGLPLNKGSVRTSNWSRKLNQQQIEYAASDAYAGFMLFHCMNAKRVAMTPVPPLPIFADQYPGAKGAKGAGPITALRLHPTEQGGDVVLAREFFNPEKEEQAAVEECVEDKSNWNTATDSRKKERRQKADATKESLSHVEQLLYNQLSARRRTLAHAQGVPPYIIATNAVLQGLVQRLPQNEAELLKVNGIGPVTSSRYGADWLEIIALHAAVYGVRDTIKETSVGCVEPQSTQPNTPTRPSRRQRADDQDSAGSSPAFDTPAQRTPSLHTGLSFRLAETDLNTDDVAATEPPSDSLRGPNTQLRHEDIKVSDVVDGADSEPHRTTFTNGESRWSLDADSDTDESLIFITPPSRPPPSLKRKRSDTRSVHFAESPTGSPTQPAAVLSPQSKIFRNKLVAFSRLVTRKLSARPPDAGPIVSDHTLDQIVAVTPRTSEELGAIEGIGGFVDACRAAQMDLLRNIVKFAPAPC